MQINPMNVEDLQTYTATPEVGYTFAVNHMRKRGGVCEAHLTLSHFTNAGGSWVHIATVPIKPIVDDCVGVAFNGNNAGFLGEARIDTSGKVYILPQNSVSDIYAVMRFMFLTNE